MKNFFSLPWAFHHIWKKVNFTPVYSNWQDRLTPTNLYRSSEATKVKRRIRCTPVRLIRSYIWDVLSFKSKQCSLNALSSIFLFHCSDLYSPKTHVLVSHRPLMWHLTPIDFNVNKIALSRQNRNQSTESTELRGLESLNL